MLAMVGEAFLGQTFDHDFGGFLEALTRLRHRDAETFIFHRRGAAAESENRPAAAHHVERRDLFCHANRIAPGQHDYRGDQLDALGAAGDIGQQLQVVGDHREAGKVMLQAHQGVEPQRLDQIDEREFLLVDVIVRPGPGLIKVTFTPTFMPTSPRNLELYNGLRINHATESDYSAGTSIITFAGPPG